MNGPVNGAVNAAVMGGGGLTIVYDERCAFCRRCRLWLAEQPAHVPLRFLAAGSDDARLRYGRHPWLAEELAVIDDTGRAWVGPDAFVVALWATRPYRALALTMRHPLLRPLARSFFHQVSSRRHRPETGDGYQTVSCDSCGCAA